MEKLELKHLAPYLPYRLNIDTSYWDDEPSPIGKNIIAEMQQDNVVCNYGWASTYGRMIQQEYSIDRIKPILRPLSDLTEIFYWDNLQDGDCELDRERINEIKNSPRGHLKLYQSNYLFKHHFDIFGLIEKGLAIDINTINP